MLEHKWKKPSPELIKLLESALLGITCDRKLMFGAPVFMINRNMFTGVHQDNIFLRLSEADKKELQKKYPEAGPFEPIKGHVMKEYIAIPGVLYNDKEVFREWLKRSHAFAMSRPPKPKRTTTGSDSRFFGSSLPANSATTARVPPAAEIINVGNHFHHLRCANLPDCVWSALVYYDIFNCNLFEEPIMKIEDLRHLIDMHFDKEEYKDAMDSCVALATEHAKEMSFDDIFKKGLCHLKLEEDAEAVGCFNKALEKEPDNLMALTNKGTCLYNMGKIADAFKIFRDVLKINPNVFPPWYYIGMHYLKIYTETGDLKAMEKMVNAYRKVLEQASDIGGFPIHDPVKDMDYRLETFVMVHGDVRELPIDELTAA